MATWLPALRRCVQGGIDSGGHENPMTAAVRELKEETGISSARIVALVRRSSSDVQRCVFLPLPAWPGPHSYQQACPCSPGADVLMTTLHADG